MEAAEFESFKQWWSKSGRDTVTAMNNGEPPTDVIAQQVWLAHHLGQRLAEAEALLERIGFVSQTTAIPTAVHAEICRYLKNLEARDGGVTNFHGLKM